MSCNFLPYYWSPHEIRRRVTSAYSSLLHIELVYNACNDGFLPQVQLQLIFGVIEFSPARISALQKITKVKYEDIDSPGSFQTPSKPLRTRLRPHSVSDSAIEPAYTHLEVDMPKSERLLPKGRSEPTYIWEIASMLWAGTIDSPWCQ